MHLNSPAVSLILALVFFRSGATLASDQTSALNERQWSEGFSGEFFSTDYDDPTRNCSGKIYSNILALPRGVRQEAVCKGRGRMISIWRQDRATAISIDTARGVYWETSGGASSSLQPAGSQPAKSVPGFIGEVLSAKLLGAEAIDGRAVDHWQIAAKGRSGREAVWDYWEDKRLLTCIRALLPGRKEYRLTKVVEARQPASLFALPHGLRKVPVPRDSPTP